MWKIMVGRVGREKKKKKKLDLICIHLHKSKLKKGKKYGHTWNCACHSKSEIYTIFNIHIKINNILIFQLMDERLIICKNLAGTPGKIIVPTLLCWHG